MNKHIFYDPRTNEPILDNIPNTIIKEIKYNYYGLFATENIKKDTVLTFLDGQIVSKQYIDAFKEYASKHGFYGEEWNYIGDDVYLLRPFRTKYGFINHSLKNPNVKIKNYCKSLIILYTVKDIQSGEEILINYLEEDLDKEYIEKNKSWLFDN